MMRRIIGVLLALAVIVVVLGLAFFIAASSITEQRRSRALANFEKPEAVKRYDKFLGNGEADTRVTDYAESSLMSVKVEVEDADDSVALAEDGYAAYSKLSEELEVAWEESLTIGWYDYNELSEEEWGQLEEFVRNHPELMDAIRAMARFGVPLQPIDFSKFTYPIQPLPHQSLVARCALLLAADIRAKGELGDAADALEDIEAGMRLSNALAGEPLRNSHSSSHAMFVMMSQAFQDVLDGGALTAEQAGAMLDFLDQSRHRESTSEVIQTSQYMAVQMLTDLNEMGTHEFLTRYAGGDSDEIGTNISVWLLGSAAVRPVVNVIVAIITEQAERAEELARLTPSDALAEYDQIFEQLLDSSLVESLGWAEVHRIFSVLVTQAEHEARLDLMRLGIAVEQYHAQHGVYPDTLDAVAPMFGGALPVDPFSGEAFQYQPWSESFLLYSLGRDREDDGGTHDLYSTDIVWRGGYEKGTQDSDAAKKHGLYARGMNP